MITVSHLEMVDGFGCMNDVIQAAKKAGCNLNPLIGSAFTTTEDFAVIKDGSGDASVRVVTLPSPKLLRFLADAIEKLG